MTGGAHLPADRCWAGVPARAVAHQRPTHPPRPRFGPGLQVLEAITHLGGGLAVAALFFLPVFPTFMLIDWIDGRILSPSVEDHGQILLAVQYALLALPASVLLVGLTLLVCAGIRWFVLPRLEPGRYPAHGRAAYGRWLSNQIQQASLDTLHGLFATVFAPAWFRLLGARVGRNAEVSTATGVVPEMLSLGEESFIADGVMLGDEEIDGGWMTLQPTTVGRRSFVGNNAYVPDGTMVPADVLIGVQSRAPDNADMQPSDTWVGSPPIRLPAREPIAGFAESLTFAPSPLRRVARGAIEALRIALPIAMTIGFCYAIVLDLVGLIGAGDWTSALGMLLIYAMVYALSCLGLVVALKWLLIGRYHATAQPMWTPFVWVSEAITNVYESLAVPNCLAMLRGTPMLPWALRLLGVRIGDGCWIDTTDVTEFDCVVIGDRAVLNADSGPQTHLFEDRIMKIGEVAIGADAVLHGRATVLYDAAVGDGAELGPLSLVMKGESLPAGTRWCGVPAAPWRE